MNINQLITLKGYGEESLNTRIDLYITFNLKKIPQRPLFALTQKLLKSKQAWQKEITSEDEYCHDCSADRGKPVYHKRNNAFYEFKQKNKKWLKQLDELNSFI